LQQQLDLLNKLEVRVLAVTFESIEAARIYAEEMDIPWPVVVDKERSLYREYGCQRSSWRHLLGWSTMKTYFREALAGRWPRWPVSDTVQQGGDILIDPFGLVRFVHVGKGPGDRPDVADIIKVCRNFTSR
jgi:hypothetical protein|tara:strand:+ start:239 stop:631 length:393 start_codon:yes stop_codon:yes gene_type:complete